MYLYHKMLFLKMWFVFLTGGFKYNLHIATNLISSKIDYETISIIFYSFYSIVIVRPVARLAHVEIRRRTYSFNTRAAG